MFSLFHLKHAIDKRSSSHRNHPSRRGSSALASYDLANLVGVCFSHSGDSIGSFGSLELKQERGKWIIEKRSVEGNGCKEKRKKFAAGYELIEQVRQIIAEYEWQELRNQPPAEEFALDEATYCFGLEFEPYCTWSISTSRKVTAEARELWKRVERLLEDASEKK